MTDAVSPWRMLAAVFCVSLVIRALNAVWLFWDLGSFLIEDSSIYLDLAEGFWNHGIHGRLLDGVLVYDFERVPFYSIILGAMRVFGGDGAVGIVCLQLVLDSLTACMIAWVGWTMAPRIGVIAGGLAALWPNMIIHSALVLTDTVFLFIVTLALVVFLVFARRPALLPAIVSGVLIGLSILTRSVGQFLPLGLLVCTVVAAWRRGVGTRAAVIFALTGLVASAAVVTPYLMRNYQQFGRVQLTNQGPNHLMNWVLPMLDVYAHAIAFDDASEKIQQEFSRYLDAEQQANPDWEMTSYDIIALRGSFSVQKLSETPVGVIVKAWGTGLVLNMGTPAVLIDPRFRSRMTQAFLASSASVSERIAGWLASMPKGVAAVGIAGIFGVAMITLFQGIGIFTLGRRYPLVLVMGVMIAAYFLLLAGPVVGPKYRLPFAPVSVLFAAIGVETVIGWIASRRRQPAV